MFMFKKKPTLAQEVLTDLEMAEREVLIHEAARERSDHMVNMYSERCSRLRSWLSEHGASNAQTQTLAIHAPAGFTTTKEPLNEPKDGN